VRNLHHATAVYANLLGLRGELLEAAAEFEPEFERENVLVPRGMGFRIGRLHLPATLLSSTIRSPGDIRCVVTKDPYISPPELGGRLPKLREEVIRQARARGKIAYERPDGLLTVSRLETDTEFYRHVKLTLRRARYLTVRAICDNLTRELKSKCSLDPFHVVDATLPLSLAVCLHILATAPGAQPQLIACKRAASLATYAGFYSGAVQALAEADKDVAVVQGEEVFDPAAAMLRELAEERDLQRLLGERLIAASSPRLGMLALVFDHRVMTYIIAGYMQVSGIRPEAIRCAIADAKEGTYELIPFPGPKSSEPQSGTLRSLCEHLTDHPWAPCCAIGIVTLLERMGFKEYVYPLLGEPIA
jgi:hypothetical protein